MNTSRRGKKRNDVVDIVGKYWNERLSACIADKGLSREEFVNCFKQKYGTGNKTDAYRWFNVGNSYKDSKIGLPTYDTMKRIADFFEVNVGYLTGETDYKSFDMGHACSFLGITERAGDAIKCITSGQTSTEHLNRFLKKGNTAVLCSLLTAPHFKEFIGTLYDLAYTQYHKLNSVSYLKIVLEAIPAELRDIAWEWRDLDDEFLEFARKCEDWNDEDIPKLTGELREAIRALGVAEGKDFSQRISFDRDIKLKKYTLLEFHLKLLDEIVCEENLSSLVGEQN